MQAVAQIPQSTNALAAAAVGLGALSVMMAEGKIQITDRVSGLEAPLRRPIALGLIAIFATILMNNGAVNMPQSLRNLLTYPEVRFAAFVLIGFLAAGDLETALIGTLFVLAVLQLLRTPAERQATPYMV